eukprot:6194826-Pleurochrysis_carterae.AAC.1
MVSYPGGARQLLRAARAARTRKDVVLVLAQTPGQQAAASLAHTPLGESGEGAGTALRGATMPLPDYALHSTSLTIKTRGVRGRGEWLTNSPIRAPAQGMQPPLMPSQHSLSHQTAAPGMVDPTIDL